MKFPQIIKDQAVYSFTEAEKASVKNGDILLFSFILNAAGACASMTVTVGISEMTYRIPVQKTRIGMPIKAEALTEISIVTDGELILHSASFENKKDATFEDLSLESGAFILDSYERIELPEVGIGVGGTIDIVKNGDHIYCIGGSTLSIVNVSDPDNARTVGKLSGIAARQLALAGEGRIAVVTGRDKGVYFISVEDPTAPRVISYYDSIEMATGLCVSGSCAFVCNRQYGVEVVDISDPAHPRHLSNMRVGGEVQSCTVKNGVFYGGLWAEALVKMYDVTDPNAPKYSGAAPLNGKGDGLCVASFDGKTYLYAATGHHTYGALSPKVPLSDLRFGQGNGFDIFDVTDPSAPVWLSSSVIDGRFYFSGYDYWETEYGVSEDGRRFVYLVSTFNGVFLYDVTDPRAPIRLMHITAPIEKTSQAYRYLEHIGRTTVLPYDQNVRGRGAFGAVAVGDGVMYAACCHTDTHIIKNAALFRGKSVETDNVRPLPVAEPYALAPDAPDCLLYRNGGQIYGVCEHTDGTLFVSAGDMGIVRLTKELTPIYTSKTEGTAIWAEVVGDTLFCAEKTAGLGIYKINADGLALKKRVCKGENVRHVRISRDKKYAVLQIGGSLVKVIDLESEGVLLKIAPHTLMYHHNLSPLIGGRYVGVFDNDPFEWWIDLENGPRLIWDKARSKTTMRTGFTAYGDKVLEVTRGGIAVFDPAKETVTDVKEQGEGIWGKPTVCGNILVSCDRIHGKITFADISDITKPTVLRTLTVKGNPDIAHYSDPYVYIPLGYQGLARIKV